MRVLWILLATVPIILLCCSLTETKKSAGALSAIAFLGNDLIARAGRHQHNKTQLKTIIKEGTLKINELNRDLDLYRTLRKIWPEMKRYLSDTLTIEGVDRFISEVLMLSSTANDLGMVIESYERFVETIDLDIVSVDSVDSWMSRCHCSVSGKMDSAYSSKDNIFRILSKVLESKDVIKSCGSVSLQQRASGLFNFIASSMMQGYLMLIYGNYLAQVASGESRRVEIEKLTREYNERMLMLEVAVGDAINKASRDLWPCDAEVHEYGKTYMHLKWLFGAMVVNEIYLNSEVSCWETCPHYQKPTVHPSNWEIAPRDSCQGNLYGCSRLQSRLYCPSRNPHRRYDGFKGYSRIFGDNLPDAGNTTCGGDALWRTSKPSSELFSSCDDCVCYCDDVNRTTTLRTFSTKTVTSDRQDNRVITGIRLVEAGRMVHIQIQDGKLRPNGVVDNSTVRWKPVEEFDYTDPSTPSSDYFTITSTRNKLYFSTITAPAGHALTGIAFDSKDDGVALRIETVKFNATTGDLNDQHSIMRTADRNWKPLQLDAPHIPILAEGENIVNARDDLYMSFRQTDWAKDAAQTAIPFLDIQPVVSEQPTLLSGAGMFHKGQPGYGGFLGMKLITYNQTEFIRKSNW